MALISKSLFVAAGLALSLLGACATPDDVPIGARGPMMRPPSAAPAPLYQPVATVPAATWAPPPVVDGLLPAPPSNAVAGECYAKVMVPGQPIVAPPPQPQAVWVLTPPGPGQLVPNWCLYYEPGAPRTIGFTAERFGWIRVICAKDASVEAIRRVQRRLNAYGDYDGSYDGHYDSETARGVARFQEQRRIHHGGYLSVQTVEALNAAPALAPPPPPLLPAFVSPPCVQSCAPAALLNPNGAAYGPYATPPYRSLLNWPGKSIY